MCLSATTSANFSRRRQLELSCRSAGRARPFTILEYTRGGRWRPACFFELAHRPVRDRILRPGRGVGVVRVISVSASKELIWNKTLQTSHRHLDPFSDHFGADTIRIS